MYNVYVGFPGGSAVKNPPANAGVPVSSLGQEDPLEKEMETHSSFLAWRIPWTEKPGGLQSMGSQRVGHKLVTKRTTNICITSRYFLTLSTERAEKADTPVAHLALRSWSLVLLPTQRSRNSLEKQLTPCLR